MSEIKFNHVSFSACDYIDQVFNKLLDLFVTCNPNISTPYLEIIDKGDGVYEVTCLIHVSPSKGDFEHDYEDEKRSSYGSSTEP